MSRDSLLERKCRYLADLLRSMMSGKASDPNDQYELQARLTALEKFWNSYTDAVIELCCYHQVTMDQEVCQGYYRAAAKLRRDIEAAKNAKEDQFGGNMLGRNMLRDHFGGAKML